MIFTNIKVPQSLKFIAYGFIVDRVIEGALFSALKVTNIYIADFIKYFAGQDRNFEYKPSYFAYSIHQRFKNYDIVDYIENHVNEVFVGLVSYTALLLMDRNNMVLPLKMFEYVSQFSVVDFISASAPNFIQPYYDFLYEKPHTLMHWFSAFKPYYDILHNDVAKDLLCQEAIDEMKHDLFFAYDYYTSVPQYLYDQLLGIAAD